MSDNISSDVCWREVEKARWWLLSVLHCCVTLPLPVSVQQWGLCGQYRHQTHSSVLNSVLFAGSPPPVYSHTCAFYDQHRRTLVTNYVLVHNYSHLCLQKCCNPPTWQEELRFPWRSAKTSITMVEVVVKVSLKTKPLARHHSETALSPR